MFPCLTPLGSSISVAGLTHLRGDHRRNQRMHIVGLMSGTSGDGVDAALVDVTGRDRSLKARTLAAHTLAYPRSLQRAFLSVSFGNGRGVCHLNALLGECLQMRRARHSTGETSPSDVALIGSHGQTLHHFHMVSMRRESAPFVLPPDRRAGSHCRRTDYHRGQFRSRDIAAGGQGSVDANSTACSEARASCTVSGKFGGISNVTYVPKGDISARCRRSIRGQPYGTDSLMVRVRTTVVMDRDGKLALRGQVDYDCWASSSRIPSIKCPPNQPDVKHSVLISLRTDRHHNNATSRSKICWRPAVCGQPRRWEPRGGGSAVKSMKWWWAAVASVIVRS